jgi:hypothetical protein
MTLNQHLCQETYKALLMKIKIDVNWEVEGSDFSFPYRIKDDACPEHIFCYAIKMLGL